MMRLFLTGVFFSLLLQAHTQSLNPLNVGTISPGDSIVVYYDATINTPCNCTQISNQGTLNGSNFSTFNTDDPKTTTANDPTITLLNMFPLPVSLLEFRGRQMDGKVELSWKASEVNVHHYEMERSTNGAAFVKIATVVAMGNGERAYNFIDPNPSGDVLYYRLKIVDVGGKISYSSVLKFTNNTNDKSVWVYPNPVLNSQVTIRLSNFSAGQYKVIFYNSLGQQVFAKTMNHGGGSLIASLTLPKNMGTGLFTVVVTGEEKRYSQKVLIEK